MSMPTLDLVVELEWTGIKTKKKLKITATFLKLNNSI